MSSCIHRATQIVLTIWSRCLFISFISAFLLRTRLAAMNKKNAEKLRTMSEDEKNAPREINVEVYDDDPHYVFMT